MRLLRSTKLRVRLLLLLLLAFAAPSSLIVWQALLEREGLVAHARQDLLHRVQLLAGKQQAVVERGNAVLDSLMLPSVLGREVKGPECARRLAERLKSESGFFQIGKLAPDGEVVCTAVPGRAGVNAGGREWFRLALRAQGMMVSDVVVGQVLGRPAITFGKAMRDETGRPLAIFYLALGTDWLQAQLRRADLPEGARALVIDGKGEVVAQRAFSDDWLGRNVADYPLARRILAERGEGVTIAPGLDDIPRLVAYAPLLKSDLGQQYYLWLSLPVAQIEAPARQRLLLTLGIDFSLLILTLGLVYWGAQRYLVRPLGVLSRTAQRFGMGDLEARSGLPHGTDEIGELTRSLEGMAAALKESTVSRQCLETEIEEHRLAEARLRVALEAATAGIYEWNPGTGASVWSQEIWWLYGLEPNSLPASYETWRQTVHPDDLERLEPLVRQAVSAGTGFEAEWRVEGAAKGSPRWLMTRAQPYRDGEGRTACYLGIVIDITGQKEVESRLARQEAQFRQLSEALPQLVWTCDKSGRCDYLSPQWVAYSGIPAAEQYGVGWQKRLHPDDFCRTRAAWRSATEQLLVFDVEYRLRRHDGVYRWFRTRALPLINEDGQASKWFGTCTDIDELKQTQEALRLASERLETAMKTSSVIAFNQDLDLRYTWFYGPSSGLRPELVLGKRDADLAERPEEAARSDAIKREVLTTGIGQRHEILRRHGGMDRCYDLSVEPLRDPNGDIVGVTCAVLDITERKLAEKRLVESEALFRATFEQAGVGFSHTAIDGRFLRVNDKFCAMLGYAREELLGLKFQDVTRPGDVAISLEGRASLIAAQVPSRTYEKRYVRKDGTSVWAQMTVVLVRNADGEPDYFVSVAQDIQQRKDVEHALEEERETRRTLLEQQVAERTAELQAANRQLESFVYASSHDLRAPLGRISSFCTLLEMNYRSRLEGDGLRFLDLIRDNASRLIRLIDDLLDHARVSQQVNEMQPIGLFAVASDIVRGKTEEIHKKNALVRLDLPEVQVLADFYGLSQVLQNLLENALKYADPGTRPVIEIGGREMDGNFRLWVRDNGIGFDMEYHDRIFEIFRRLHTYADYPGSGVGLALVKRAMERMGGRVWAESRPGQGASFFLEFRMPAKAGEMAVGGQDR